MKFLNNYWAETAQSVKKLALALRTLIGTVTASAYVQGNVQLAFYILLLGAVIDFLLNFLPPDKPGNPGTPVSTRINLGTAILLVLALFITSCSIIKPQVNTLQKDSTYISYKPIDWRVKGAKVNTGLNLDSLYHLALFARDARKEDSLATYALQLKYKNDSLIALRANKPLPPRPPMVVEHPKIQYLTDPETKAQLSYWVDQFGKLQIGCEAKDQTLHTLQTTITNLKSKETTTTQIAYKTPTWNWLLIGGLTALLIVSGIFLHSR